MKPSDMLITIIIFLAFVILGSTFMANFTDPYTYDKQFSNEKFNNTFNKFNDSWSTTTDELVDTQTLLRNNTLRRDEDDITNDNIVKVSIKALKVIYNSGKTATNITANVQDTLNMPSTVLVIVVTLVVLLIVVGILSLFFKKDI